MHVYFSGIGGAGLAPLAEIAQDAGYQVSGSDLYESLGTSELEKRGVDVVFEQTAQNIAAEHLANPIDWFVHTSALAEDHPELTFAHKNGIKISKRDEFLAEFIKEKDLKLIAIAGTHGKTTTTGLAVWLASQLDLPVSYSIGTTISFGPSGKYDSDSKYFIYECDEYDNNFLQFYPEIAILPSVDYDHADIFKTVDDYKQAFSTFLSQSNQAVMFEATAQYLQPADNTSIEAFEHQPSFDEISLPGQHLRNNAFLVAEAFKLIDDYSDEILYQALGKFPGTDRRFEKIGDGLYNDFAHHPTEIAATLQAALELNPNVVIVYQPHQNMRQHSLINQYKNVFDGAKQVYWLPTYQPAGDREKNDVVLTPNDLIAKLANPEIAESAELNDELWDTILSHIAAGDLVVLMSAGNADAWLREKAAN